MTDTASRWRLRKWLWFGAAVLSLLFLFGKATMLAPPVKGISADLPIYVSLAALVISVLNFAIAWRKERREQKIADLGMEKTRLEIEKMRREAPKP